MVFVELSRNNPFLVRLETQGENRRLGVNNYQELTNSPEEAQDLLRTIMVAHLIAPDLPEIIETNFPVENVKLINSLYSFYNKNNPEIHASTEQVVLPKSQFRKATNEIKYTSAHSGGLDSAYRITKLISSGESVLAVHLRNLNRKGNYMEANASRLQTEVWNVPYKQLDLVNSSNNNGYKTMRTRDLLLATASALVGMGYGSKNVLIEGDFVKDRNNAEFSEYQETWDMFNKMLKDMNLEIEIKGMDAGDIETVGEAIKLEKDLNKPILNLVQNCFSASYQLPGIRRKWERETPVIAESSSKHWCGSCIKCRRMSLGRLYYHDPAFDAVGNYETNYFIKDTYRWMHDYQHNRSLISESFQKHLAQLSSVR